MPDKDLDQFSSELIALLQAASTRRVEVMMPSRSSAVSLRYQFYHLRAKIRKQSELHMLHMTRCQCRIEPNPSSRINPLAMTHRGPWKVICEPISADINDEIRAALSKQAPDVLQATETAPVIPDVMPDSGEGPSILPASVLDKLVGREPLGGEPPPEEEV